MSKPTEEDLQKAAQALGEATQKCSEEERGHIKLLYEAVKNFADEQKAKGVLVDRSAFFAAALIFHAHIENEELRAAAIKYVDLDVLFTKETVDAST